LDSSCGNCNLYSRFCNVNRNFILDHHFRNLPSVSTTEWLLFTCVCCFFRVLLTDYCTLVVEFVTMELRFWMFFSGVSTSLFPLFLAVLLTS
jgi:hypothetical protein